MTSSSLRIASALALLWAAGCVGVASSSGSPPAPDGGTPPMDAGGSVGLSVDYGGAACAELGAEPGGTLLRLIVTASPSTPVEVRAERPSCGVAPFVFREATTGADGQAVITLERGAAECGDPLEGAWLVHARAGSARSGDVAVVIGHTSCGLDCSGAAAHCPETDGVPDAGTQTPDAGPPPPPADAGSDPECVTGTAPWSTFTSTSGEPSRHFELPMEIDVAYRTVTIELEVEPGQWQPTCWNPASSRPMAPFQVLASIRRGTRFCRGGNAGGVSVRGPGNDDIWADSYYSPIVGSSCSGEEWNMLGSHPRHDLELDTPAPVRLHIDAARRISEIQVGSVTRTGTVDPNLELIARDGGRLYLFTSLEKWLECYEEPGSGDPDPPCCHLPSLGWTYRNVRYSICR